MGFGGFVALCIGIGLVILSANGRLQNVIAAALGQQAPGATPLTGWASDPGSYGTPSAGGWGGILGGLLGGGGAPNPYGDNPPGETQGGVPYLP